MNQLLSQKYLKELHLDFKRPNSLLNKIKLCSYLICCGASVELDSYPLNNKDFRTGNAGLQLNVGSPHLRALIPFFYMENDNPVKIRGSYLTGKAVIEHAGKRFFEVSILPDVETGNENINLEFDTLIAAIPEKPYGIRNCYYYSIGKPCAFCILKKKNVNLGPEDLVKAYKRVSRKRGKEPQVLLTGGNSGRKDRGLSKYVPYVEQLRRHFRKSRIAIEVSPPKDESSIDVFLNFGVDTFAANIEFFSVEAKKELLPGKSEIPIEEYEKAFEHCQKHNVKTFSAVIAGPEAMRETLSGVKYLAEIGVPTNLICLRPFPGARLEDYPRVNPAKFLKVTKKAVMIMERYDVMDDLASTAGCGSCGACSMEMNLYRLLKSDKGGELHDFFLN
jgi:hypothetical protein